jgi:hypothetical protein
LSAEAGGPAATSFREVTITIRLLVLGVLVIATLAGCKLVITVPTGGEVISQSGDKNCAQGKTCPFDIVDLFFIDIFTARPAPGYRFKHWKKKNRGLCGGKAGFCELYTAPLRGNPLLEAILETDEKFYLEPVFEKSTAGDEGPVSKQNASVCFNPDLVRTGNTLNLEYSSIDNASGAKTISETVQTVLGPSQFKGKSVTEIRSEISVPAARVTAVANNFLTADLANKTITNLGGTGDTIVNGVPSGAIEMEFTPGVESPFNLGAGQKFTQTYTSKTTTNINGAKFTTSLTQEQVINYIGVVSIAIAAGSYQACKFQESSTGKSQGATFTNSRTYWLGVGLGIQLKEINESATTELLAGNIDGRPI